MPYLYRLVETGEPPVVVERKERAFERKKRQLYTMFRDLPTQLRTDDGTRLFFKKKRVDLGGARGRVSRRRDVLFFPTLPSESI